MDRNKSRYSCADFTFPLLPHDKALLLIKLLGFDAVDLGIFEDRSHHYPTHIAKDPVKEATRIAKDLHAAGLQAADVFLQTGAEPPVAAANSPDGSVRAGNRALFLKMLDFTCVLGCRHITGLPGVKHEGVDFQDDWKRSCEEAYWRVEAAKEKNIVYSVEPHVGSILPDADSSLRFIQNCPGITLTLDYGHFVYQGQTNESVHPLIPYASHFHARGGAKGKLQTIVKENEIDFETIMPRLTATGYAGFICMEYVYSDWEGCNRTDNVSETLLLQELLHKISFNI
ncbi:TIM barrel protein [Agriterribacter sp.]|uniref:sugar phosphate isomerase/epimerase family protein n=1 Tax=Agriterribacter sp. TaxID=2821509 RepID=UPI002BF06B48|nr:TIM barrel protein [Agriterribacter sp.]HRP57021.1 TIM barrel protein [Agriterribacter sp.]